jgi:transporter family protein
MSNLQLVIITIIGWGVGSLLYKVANDNIHPMMVTLICTFLYVVFLPIQFFLFKIDTKVNITGVIYSLLGGLIMGIGSLAFFFALQKGEAGKITAATSLYPALTLILSMIFMNETMSFKKGLGVAFALVSVYLLSQK